MRLLAWSVWRSPVRPRAVSARGIRTMAKEYIDEADGMVWALNTLIPGA